MPTKHHEGSPAHPPGDGGTGGVAWDGVVDVPPGALQSLREVEAMTSLREVEALPLDAGDSLVSVHAGDGLVPLDEEDDDPGSLSSHPALRPITGPSLAVRVGGANANLSDPPPARPGGLTGPLEEGAIVGRRYKVRGVLGVGGSAVVYRVFDGRKGVERALKILDVRSALPDIHERFWQEIRVSVAVQHPNVVAVHDHGEWEGRPYLVMELLQGRSLGDLMAERKGRPLPLRVALELMTQAARGLAAAHHLGVVHRDLKPGNLFVSPRLDHVTITDFGLARAVGLTAAITGAGIVVGTPAYTPPERLRDGGSSTIKGDLYALGVVLYEVLTGELLFRAPSLPEIVDLVDTFVPPPPSTYEPSIPQVVDEYVLNLLDKNPAHRVGSAAMLADALAEVAARL